MGDYQSALPDFNRAIDLAVGDPYRPAWAYYNRGIAHSDQDQYELDIPDLDEAVFSMPDFPDAFSA